MKKEIVRRWFMIHTYSGYEKKVQKDLEQKIEKLGMTDIVPRILVPEEEIIDEKSSKKKRSRKLFPGYVMVEMEAIREETDDGINFKVDSEAWYVVRNTNGVTGFVGVGSDPIPMEEEEVTHVFSVIGYSDEDKELEYKIGQYVHILTGDYRKKDGRIEEVDIESKKVKVSIETIGEPVIEELKFEDITLITLDCKVGDYVIILTEGFENQEGKIEEINNENQTVKVSLEMFGRNTPIEFNFINVKKA